MSAYEMLWVAVVVLGLINFLLFLCMAFVMFRVGKLERLTEALTDPDEYINMLSDLEAERKRRSVPYLHVVPEERPYYPMQS